MSFKQVKAWTLATALLICTKLVINGDFQSLKWQLIDTS